MLLGNSRITANWVVLRLWFYKNILRGVGTKSGVLTFEIAPHSENLLHRRRAYRVSQKFVPLNTCDITFDRNYTSAWNFLKTFIALLSTYIRKVYIRHVPLCLLSRSEAFAAWSGISHVAWRAGFSSRLVWAVFSDPSWFRSWVFIDNLIHYAPKILHRVDIWGIWGPACFLYKIWQVFFCTMPGWPWLGVLAPRLGRTSCGD